MLVLSFLVSALTLTSVAEAGSIFRRLLPAPTEPGEGGGGGGGGGGGSPPPSSPAPDAVAYDSMLSLYDLTVQSVTTVG